jgi:hypothetical protein
LYVGRSRKVSGIDHEPVAPRGHRNLLERTLSDQQPI